MFDCYFAVHDILCDQADGPACGRSTIWQ